MGFKRYLLWNDAIYGNSSNWINFNHNVSKNCTLAPKCPLRFINFRIKNSCG